MAEEPPLQAGEEYAHPFAAVIKHYGSSIEGLTQEEADKRLLRDGVNCLPQKKKMPAFVRFLLQFHDELVYMLMAVMIFCFAMQ
jgi:magnesium-transporting ATPase (P-type)